MSYRVSKRRVTRVSSAAMRPTSPSTLRARRVMSSRLPMGVETIYNVGIDSHYTAWKTLLTLLNHYLTIPLFHQRPSNELSS